MKPNELYNLICDTQYNKVGIDVDYKILVIDRTIYLLFQETTNKIDWRTNFNFPLKLYKKYYVHKGFATAYKSANDIIMNELKQVMIEHSDSNIVVAGWSYGGAMSQLAVEDIYYRFNIKPILVTFGAPRIFFTGIKHFRESVNCAFMYANINDVVTKVVPYYKSIACTKIDKYKLFGIFNPRLYHCKYGHKELYND